jgi:hypothetical protein
MKQPLFLNPKYNLHKNITPLPPNKENINKTIQDNHTSIVQTYLHNLPPNKISQTSELTINNSEQSLPRATRVTLAQLRANKSPFLFSYKHLINPTEYPSPLCPLCKIENHDTPHLFKCPCLPTQLTPQDLWTDPEGVEGLLAAWLGRLGSA